MRICVIGLGNLGLPIASAFKSQGFDVVGVDTNEALIQSLRDRTFKTDEPDVSLEGITFRTEVPSTCSAAFICVQTPSKPDGAFDDKYVREAVLSSKLIDGLIVIVSTLMPGQSRKIAEDFKTSLCYSPTFIRLGSVVKDFLDADVRIIGSTDKSSLHVLEMIYCLLPPAPIKHMSLESAEIAKLAINCFITTKIAYANQLQMLCESVPNSDVDDVTEAMGMDDRIGPKSLKAGMPFGGPCFPRDVKALKSTGYGPRDLTSYNENHARALRLFMPILPPAKIILLGKSYRVGTSVTKGNPSDSFWGFHSDDVKDISKADFVVICTQDLRWLQGDYRDKIVLDPWGYFKEYGVKCKQLITPGRRR